MAQTQPVTTASGLVYESIKDGTGASSTTSDIVKVHHKGTFLYGMEFNSSHKRGEPGEFPLNRAIPPNATLNFEIELVSVRR